MFIQYGVKNIFNNYCTRLTKEICMNGKKKKCIEDNICCGLFKIILPSVLDCLESFRLEITCYAQMDQSYFLFGVSTKHCPKMTRTVCARLPQELDITKTVQNWLPPFDQ